jgi:hypothetical protein
MSWFFFLKKNTSFFLPVPPTQRNVHNRPMRHASPLLAALLSLAVIPARAADRLNLLDYAPRNTKLDRTGTADASAALAAAITAANAFTSRGLPACIHIPAGIYRIVTPPPAFQRAGCIAGDGPSQSTLKLDPLFTGDLFAWSESWVVTTPGPAVTGLTIRGARAAPAPQNALVFYDRNDQVFIDNVDIIDLPGRALYSGATRHMSQAYMRESRLRALRLFNDGTQALPVIEFASAGTGQTDASNEIDLAQIDMFGPYGPGLVIRNNGAGAIRDINFVSLRIEGWQSGTAHGDLLTIGDPHMRGRVNNIRLTDVELIDPQTGYAALRLTAAPGAEAPYQITFQGLIGGGAPRGQGLRIESGRSSVFRFSGLHSFGTNVVIGLGVSGIVLDGGGQERRWTYSIDPTSAGGIAAPVVRPLP